MIESAVPCPACGAASVPPGATAPCPRCGLVVAARPRVRAEPDPDPPPRGRPVVLAVSLLGLLAVGGVIVWARYQQAEAARMEQRARDEALAAEDRAWDEQRLARDRAARRAALAALPAQLPALLPGGAVEPVDTEKLAAEFGTRVVGVWRGPGADGGTREVEYRADGTFRDAVTGGPAAREWAGTWTVRGVTGTRVLHVIRTGGGPPWVKLSFEGDELIHDDTPGRATVLRR